MWSSLISNNSDAPAWLKEAAAHLGVREIPGPKHEPKILQWWKAIKRGGIKDDETPWCAAFVGGCLEATGSRSTRFESARSYLAWGFDIAYPALGAIVVFSRTGGGHVGFCVGRTPEGDLYILGGNQKNEVNVSVFPRKRVLGYRWPHDAAMPPMAPVIRQPAGKADGLEQ